MSVVGRALRSWRLLWTGQGVVVTVDELVALKSEGLYLGEAAVWSTGAHQLSVLSATLFQAGHAEAAETIATLARKWGESAGTAAKLATMRRRHAPFEVGEAENDAMDDEAARRGS